MKRIMVVDDDADFRRMLCQTLLLAGFEVLSAEDGAKALELDAENPFDLVITDLIMPDKDGIELIMELRRRHPGQKVIAISGGGMLAGADYLAIASHLGALKTLIKPFMVAEFLDVVGILLAPPSNVAAAY